MANYDAEDTHPGRLAPSTSEVCRRCGGSGKDPEFEGACGACSECSVCGSLVGSATHFEECEGGVLALRERVEKYYVKARVYGAIACRFREALEKIAAPGTTGVVPIAKEALAWRHSEKGGVPRSAVEEMDALLKAAETAECPEGDRNGVCREKAEVCGAHYRTALLRIEDLKKRIESGQAAHRDDRTARDWLARENDRLKVETKREIATADQIAKVLVVSAEKRAEAAEAEVERLRTVIRTGGAMYRAERSTMGIPGGMDPDPREP